MLRGWRNAARLLALGRTLARHDATFALTMAGAPKSLTRAIGLLARPDPAMAKLEPGERLSRALQAMGPSFIKLGQTLSVRPDVAGIELARALGGLRDNLPPFPFEKARAMIEAEFGRPLEDLFASFDIEPVAAASIAQVHYATGPEGETWAVKLLRPGIEAAMARDLELFYWLARWIERLAPKARRLRPVAAVETLENSIRLELDLRLEAAAADEMRADMIADRDNPNARMLYVPAIEWSRTAKRVLTQERIDGISTSDLEALRAAGHDTERLAADLIQSFLTQSLVHGFFHADMHQGNLFVMKDGRLAAVDFGIMGRLDDFTRRVMADMLLAFIEGDYARAAEVHFEAGYVPAHQSLDAFTQACRSVGAPILGKPVKDISLARLLGQLFEVTETFGMETQPQLLLLQKSMVTVEGVARSLNDAVNFWDVSRPIIKSWLENERGLEARLNETARALRDFALDAPRVLDGLRRWAIEPRPTVVANPAPPAPATPPWRGPFVWAALGLGLALGLWWG